MLPILLPILGRIALMALGAAVVGWAVAEAIDEINEALMCDEVAAAEEKLDEIESHQDDDLAAVYREYQHRMSAGTRKLFEQRVARRRSGR